MKWPGADAFFQEGGVADSKEWIPRSLRRSSRSDASTPPDLRSRGRPCEGPGSVRNGVRSGGSDWLGEDGSSIRKILDASLPVAETRSRNRNSIPKLAAARHRCVGSLEVVAALGCGHVRLPHAGCHHLRGDHNGRIKIVIEDETPVCQRVEGRARPGRLRLRGRIGSAVRRGRRRLVCCCSGFVVAWVLVIRVKTTNGMIELVDLPKDAEVLVDGEEVAITWPGGGKPAVVTVTAGKHKIMVKKDGLEISGDEVTVQADGKEKFTVRFVAPTRLPHELPKDEIKELGGTVPIQRPDGNSGRPLRRRPRGQDRFISAINKKLDRHDAHADSGRRILHGAVRRRQGFQGPREAAAQSADQQTVLPGRLRGHPGAI